MSSLMKWFKRWLNGPTDSRQGGRVTVAAFGKHPGWADFMDDIGLVTPALVATKWFYVEGIEKNIGRWAELESRQSALGFGHAFVWCRDSDIVAGRLWPSQDHQGRSSYPMVVCAHCQHVAVRWVYDRVLPRLASLETECRNSDSASGVLACISACQEDLQTALDTFSSSEQQRCERVDRVGQLTDYSGLGLDDEGLIRVLYHIDREMSAGLVRPIGRGGDTHSADARIPVSATHLVEASILWTSLLLSQYGQHTGVLIIIPQHGTWIDVIVGDPVPAQLYCLRAPLEGLPLTNTVVYRISDEFAEKVRQRVGISRASGSG
jgi:hypothetical protein